MALFNAESLCLFIACISAPFSINTFITCSFPAKINHDKWVFGNRKAGNRTVIEKPHLKNNKHKNASWWIYSWCVWIFGCALFRIILLVVFQFSYTYMLFAANWIKQVTINYAVVFFEFNLLWKKNIFIPLFYFRACIFSCLVKILKIPHKFKPNFWNYI